MLDILSIVNGRKRFKEFEEYLQTLLEVNRAREWQWKNLKNGIEALIKKLD